MSCRSLGKDMRALLIKGMGDWRRCRMKDGCVSHGSGHDSMVGNRVEWRTGNEEMGESWGR